MQQTFALTLSPHTGRVSVRPVVNGKQACEALFTFASEELAQAFLDNAKAVKVRGDATINGTYRMEIVPTQQEVSK